MSGLVCVALWSSSLALADTATNIDLNLITGGDNLNWENTLVLGQTGSVGTLGNAALVFTSSSGGFSNGNSASAQVTAEIAFNEVDTIAISFTYPAANDFLSVTTINLSGGMITGGTGAYAGASGSLNLTIVKDAPNSGWSTSTTTGSGSVTVGGNAIPLTLANFRGWCCGWPTRELDYDLVSVSVTGSLGNGSGTSEANYYLANAPTGVYGYVTINFNTTDSLFLIYTYPPTSSQTIAPPSSFTGSIAGGTGKYADAYGTVNWSTTDSGFHVTGTMTLPSGAATITQVKTIFGWPWMSLNAWLEIHGTNLVPADTPSSGVDWSNAPEFASGQMPTQLGPVSVSFDGGSPGYIYFYCSAQTNPNCADDQINVLAPLLPFDDPAMFRVTVNNNGDPVAITAAFKDLYSPAFLSFDAMGHIAARHLDASLVGPASLYPGSSTPAEAGETISLYGAGFGPVSQPIVAGSATQSGTMQAQLSCWVSGLNAQAAGALVSPGLYQINLTIPQGVPSGDNPVICIYSFYVTFPGALITVQ